MKAIVFNGPGKPLAVEELTLEGPKPGEVKIRLAAAGVCHSDLHVLKGEWKHRTPLVLGHEGAGTVMELGEGVSGLQVGDHVILSWMPACGICRYCLSGRPQLCEDAGAAIGTDALLDGTTRLSRQDGEPVYHYLSSAVFAEEAVVPAKGAIRIREDAPLGSVCIIGCAVATGVGAVLRTARVPLGSSVVVIGCGAVGLSAIQGAWIAGAYPLVAIDVVAEKMETAKTFGATHVVDASAGDPVAAVQEIVVGGVDYVFECIGLRETCEQAMSMLAPGGAAVIVGQPKSGTAVTIDPLAVSCWEHRVIGCNYGSMRPSLDFPKLVDLYMNGRLKIDEMITHRRPLAEAQLAFDDLAAGREIRTVLDCS